VKYTNIYTGVRHTSLVGWFIDRLPKSLRSAMRHNFVPDSKHIPYQGIIYRDQVLKPGWDRRRSYRQVFPTAPAGKTILDLGCNAGYYCFMAAGEGAAYCRGVDHKPEHVNLANQLVADHHIPNLEFAVGDIAQYPVERSFDVILCLNVLRHLRSIEEVEAVLDRAYAQANERLVLMVPIVPWPDVLYVYDYTSMTSKRARLRFSARYFQLKFGLPAVSVTRAYTYGDDRICITIRKPGSGGITARANA
jgi:SAM-dependent methyltransferase